MTEIASKVRCSITRMVVDLRRRSSRNARCSAGRVPLNIAYVLTCRMPGIVVLMFRDDRAKDAELLMLRHENKMSASMREPAWPSRRS
jgi:hypothetical protein